MGVPSSKVLLPPDPMSVPRARRHVMQVLREAGRDDWADDAGLAVTEIVTNVVLHAITACEVSVSVAEQHVRVAVRDFSNTLPVQMTFSPDATTGRGLSVVARLSADYGIDPLGAADGKVVWFVLDGSSRGDEADGAAGEWDFSGLLTERDGDDEVRTAVLRQVPMVLWLAGLEHWAAVLRELYLLMASAGAPPAEAGVDLAAAGDALRLLSHATDRALDDAPREPWRPRPASLPPGHLATGPQVPAVLDITVTVGSTPTKSFGVLQDTLDYGRKMAMAGRLLVRPALEDVVTLRNWVCEQVIAQDNGVPATSWDQVVSRLPVALAMVHQPPDWDDTEVRTSTRPALAADDSNRLIAASDAALELLRCTADELIGQRITTIMPHRLREQHVAGFTRHLTTGQTRALGVELDLPVLRLDGTEVMCRFLIEQVAAPAGRRVYVARFEPLPPA